MHSGIIRKASGSSEVEINVRALLVSKESLYEFDDKDRINGYCEDGCGNFGRNWSCPPFSKSYRELSEGYKNVLVVMYYSRLDQFGRIGEQSNRGNDLRDGCDESLSGKQADIELVSHAHEYLKSEIDRLMHSLESAYKGVSILNGHCRLCGSCACEMGLPCRKPYQMRYSMESLGLDVEAVSLDLFQHKILWYENNKLPEHSTILSCLLTNSDLEESCIATFLK